MGVTKEYLEKERQSLMLQRAQALEAAQQASGAILLIDSLLPLFDEPVSLTVDEFKDALGAKSVEIVPLNPEAE